MVMESFPIIIGWELTLACNLNCRHCGSSAGRARKDELTLEESLAICDQMPELLVQEVDFTGGEPLLNINWSAIARRLKDLGIKTRIVSNGVDTCERDVALMKEVGVSGVGFSLDGLESSHDLVRGRQGLFKKLLNSISMMRQADIPVSVITTVNRLNLKELPAMLKLLNAQGVKRWQLQPITRLGRAQTSSTLMLTENGYLELGRFIKELAVEAPKVDIDACIADSLGYFTDYDTRNTSWGGCPAGYYSCGITSNGMVKGCLSLPDELIEGDLRKNDLWDIWFDPSSFSFSRDFKESALGDNCLRCDKGEQCRGGCSAVSYGSTGSFHNNPNCFYRMRERTPTAL